MRWAAVRGLGALMLAAGATPAALGTPALTPFAAELLADHNHERALVGVPPLRWDDDLARDASRWAYRLAASGRFEHSPDDPNDADPQGENLWEGTRGDYRPSDAVALWAAEKFNYRARSIPDSSRTGDFEDVGHYTQMVWRDTRTVGCAMARGGADDVIVCRYASGGNVIGERAY